MAPFVYNNLSTEIRTLFEELDSLIPDNKPDGKLDDFETAYLENRLSGKKGLDLFLNTADFEPAKYERLGSEDQRDIKKMLEDYTNQIKDRPRAVLLTPGSTITVERDTPAYTASGIIVDPWTSAPDLSVLDSGYILHQSGELFIANGRVKTACAENIKGIAIEDGELLQGSFKIHTRGGQIYVKDDGEVEASGRISLVTNNAEYRIEADAGSKFKIITDQYGLPNVKTQSMLKICPDGRDENEIFLEEGLVRFYDEDRFGIGAHSKFGFGEPPSGAGDDISKEYSKFEASKPIYLAFGELNPGQVLPDQYRTSTIEIVARQNDYETMPRLKVTLRNGASVDAELQNTGYDSIYVDSTGGTLKITQLGANLSAFKPTGTANAGGDTGIAEKRPRTININGVVYKIDEYYSRITLREGSRSPEIEGKKAGEDEYLPFVGNRIVSPMDASFDKRGQLMGEGFVRVFEPSGDGESYELFPPDVPLGLGKNTFNIFDYHNGVELPVKEGTDFFWDYINLAQISHRSEVAAELTLISANPELMKRVLEMVDGGATLPIEQCYRLAKAYFKRTGKCFGDNIKKWAEILHEGKLEAIIQAFIEMGGSNGDAFYMALDHGELDLARSFQGNDPDRLTALKIAEGKPEEAIKDYLERGNHEKAANAVINELRDFDRGVDILKEAGKFEEAAGTRSAQAYMATGAEKERLQDQALNLYRKVSPEKAADYLKYRGREGDKAMAANLYLEAAGNWRSDEKKMMFCLISAYWQAKDSGDDGVVNRVCNTAKEFAKQAGRNEYHYLNSCLPPETE